MRTQKVVLTIVMGAAIAGLLTVLYLDRPAAPELRAGTQLLPPRPVDEFQLLDQHGRAFTRATLAGRWHLLFSGFTHCPDICPGTLAQLDALQPRLTNKENLRTVFVSLDPGRDTPQLLGRYLGAFSTGFIGATGEKVQIDRLCASLGLGYVINPGTVGAYTVDHSGALVLIDPQARIAAYFQPPFDLDLLATDLDALMSSER
jgi:protein SCO1/2